MIRARTLMTCLALVAVACALAPQRATPDGPLALRVESVQMHAAEPDAERIGALAWRGGLALRSENGAFGGWSGLVVSPDGSRMTAVGDKGSWLEATLVYDRGGGLLDVREATIDGIRGTDGMAVTSTAYRDAEALARLADGSLLVAFEQRHRLWRYPPGERPLSRAARPEPAPPRLAGAPATTAPRPWPSWWTAGC